MSLIRLICQLRQPLVALALCTLLAQQMVGFVLTASPVMAYEAGFSLCLNGSPPSNDDPASAVVSGAGFCPCTMQHVAGVLPVQGTVKPIALTLTDTLLPAAQTRSDMGLSVSPPSARAPPVPLHIA